MVRWLERIKKVITETPTGPEHSGQIADRSEQILSYHPNSDLFTLAACPFPCQFQGNGSN